MSDRTIYASLSPLLPPRTAGSGENFRMEVSCRVHSSPIKAAADRPVSLILTDAQAKQLAMEILQRLPALELSGDANFRYQLDRLCRVLSVEDRIETDPAAV